jgi:hypothetical protein
MYLINDIPVDFNQENPTNQVNQGSDQYATKKPPSNLFAIVLKPLTNHPVQFAGKF